MVESCIDQLVRSLRWKMESLESMILTASANGSPVPNGPTLKRCFYLSLRPTQCHRGGNYIIQRRRTFHPAV